MDDGPLRAHTPICNRCRHFYLGTFRCAAYPDGIPDAILFNKVDHHAPYVGDHGIQFEAGDAQEALERIDADA